MLHYIARGKYSNKLVFQGMKNIKKQKYQCKRVQKSGQKCKNSPVHLKNLKLP